MADAPSSAFFAERLAGLDPASPVPSPCVNLCTIDPDTRLCLGCRRTLDEIAAWSGLSDAGKHAVWLQLPDRRPTAQEP